MIFLFGPLYGGKHDFACRLLGCTPEELKSRAADHVENHAAQARDLEALADELAKSDATAESLKSKTDALAEKAMKLGEAVYKASQEAAASENSESKPNEDGPRDADFSEKK